MMNPTGTNININNQNVQKPNKICKLAIHQSQFSDENMLINSSDFPFLKEGDFIKVLQYKDQLLSTSVTFRVKQQSGDLQKDTISIKNTIANLFNLQVFLDVKVEKVEPEEVTIDLLEVTFKDQYISRSDMWRMKKDLMKSCVYIDQYVSFSEIFAQVSELWVNSQRVRSGYIDDTTNFVLRSFTAKVCVFIQMSAEMWEYDQFGYLKYEKAVDGLLRSLVQKWKEKKCCHDLTIVLFSRTIYADAVMEDFPVECREVVRVNHHGELYIDFYKCVEQVKGLHDSLNLILTLRKLFHKYEKLVQLDGCPKGQNTNAAEGNFLEAINFSLNMFEKHQIDRNFDRTGQLVVCITPGVGVFEVDRDLTVLTRERMLDNGIGSDLICLGQQPLHAVPLFTFHHDTVAKRKEFRSRSSSDPFECGGRESFHDFNIPHWINHSFYTSNPFPDKGTTNINYIPRIHVPSKKLMKTDTRNGGIRASLMTGSSPKPTSGSPDLSKSPSQNELPTIKQTDYSAYDRSVFGYQKPSNLWMKYGTDQSGAKLSSSSATEAAKKKQQKRMDELRQISINSGGDDKDSLLRHSTRPVRIPSSASSNLKRLMKTTDKASGSVGANNTSNSHLGLKHDRHSRHVVGSASALMTSSPDRGVLNNSHQLCFTMTSSHHHHHHHRYHAQDGGGATTYKRRALFNPFNPLHMFAPLTANRRRWVHTYPRGPQGEALVLHHQKKNSRRSRRHHRTSSQSRQISESTDDETIVVDNGSGWMAGIMVDDNIAPSSSPCNNIGTGLRKTTDSVTSAYLSTSQGSNVSTITSCCSGIPEDSIDGKTNLVDEIVPLHHGSLCCPHHHHHHQHYDGEVHYHNTTVPLWRYGLSWIWGMAGDVQWTSDTNTGLDWKSLQCPACLPITTDFYPNTNHLTKSCSEFSYHLVPDECSMQDFNSRDTSESSITSKQQSDISTTEHRTTREIFLELVNQRLCHGFQIIKATSKRTRNNDSSSSCSTLMSPTESAAYSYVTNNSASTNSPLFLWSSAFENFKVQSPDAYMLSHGKQYHIVKLLKEEEKIEVKIYKPKHPFTPVGLNYSYMLWPKMRDRFQSNQCVFKHEKLEDYYWNHHDEYICDSVAYDLIPQNLKFWQTRFVVLPNPSKRLRVLKNNSSMSDDVNSTTSPPRFDVFGHCPCERHEDTFDEGECSSALDNLIRFVDMLNKIRRPNQMPSRKSWAGKSMTSLHSYGSIKSYVPHTTFTLGGPSPHPPSSTPTPPATARPTSSTPTSECSTPIRMVPSNTSYEGNDTPNPPSSFSSQLLNDVQALQPVPVRCRHFTGPDKMTSTITENFDDTLQSSNLALELYSNSEYHVILDAMKDEKIGLKFLPEDKDLPNHSFLAIEAVHWALSRVQGIEDFKQACTLFDGLQKHNFITHCSGNQSRRFVYGYVIFCIHERPGSTEIEDPTSYQYQDRVKPFSENRWFEIEFKRRSLVSSSMISFDESTKWTSFTSSHVKRTSSHPSFMRSNHHRSRHCNNKKQDVRYVKIPLNNKKIAERREWCQVKYSNQVKIGIDTLVFSFELQWMVATATCLFSLLNNWSRDASRSDLYLVPLPKNPFPPHSHNFDPIRVPLFVPIDSDVILQHYPPFINEPPSNVELNAVLIDITEKILLRFGFLRLDQTFDSIQPSANNSSFDQHNGGCNSQSDASFSRDFIHCTGQIMAGIPIRGNSFYRHSLGNGGNLETHLMAALQELDSDDIDPGKAGVSAVTAGVYWSHNYMQTKRWKCNWLDDCPWKQLTDDFVAFCSNTDHRLADFVSSAACLFNTEFSRSSGTSR